MYNVMKPLYPFLIAVKMFPQINDRYALVQMG